MNEETLKLCSIKFNNYFLKEVLTKEISYIFNYVEVYILF